MMFNVLCRRQGGVLNWKETNKENVPLYIISNTIQRSTRINRVPITNPRGKWLSESLKISMDAIGIGITSL
jgi:hypothetical protein